MVWDHVPFWLHIGVCNGGGSGTSQRLDLSELEKEFDAVENEAVFRFKLDYVKGGPWLFSYIYECGCYQPSSKEKRPHRIAIKNQGDR